LYKILNGSPEAFKPVRQHCTGKSHPGKNIAAIAWARARDGTGWKLVLSFADRDGRDHQLLVKRCEIMKGDLLFELLDMYGYPILMDAYSRAALRRSILAADPEQVSVPARGGNSAVSARRAECPIRWSPARA
jgi:hypothetical protein